MQDNNHIQNLLKKFILNQCSKEEIDQVVQYVQDLTESTGLPTVEEVLAILDEKPVMAQEDAIRIQDSILATPQKQKKTIKRKFHFVKYAAAAILVGLFGTTYLLKDAIFNKPVQVTAPIVKQDKKATESGTDKATLTLANGSQIALVNGTSLKTQNAKSNGAGIVYDANENTNKIVYNYLTIPRGGKFFIKLSDGTQVWLNSETKLKFPVAFIEGQPREVELVYGEAYFAVSPSTKHKGAHFKVLSNKQLVDVIGTEFNIKAYKDEVNSYTTLVEGKVAVNIGARKLKLTPNQQLSLNTETSNPVVKNVDVYNEISWKEGVFSFEKITLKDMMKVLSRWYDVDFVFKNKAIENEIFDGVLRKTQTLDEILKSIKNFKIIKNYEIKDQQVILE
ncbi:FecR family protein [Flavobacterium flevense]|uniref:Iron dicitrate transporter FecR n=1 Tax=Flavobacterium flevense TaxID=983 RepID=A0A4Y4AZV1_9FLAO|nr:FecR family protein [Flavobacterium flevense]GEC72570.1 iron dicitrate transporter FecR [Flavobacterium flevense]SHL34373.1 FecR family protein [Flavobacterium flevense]